MLRIRSSKKAFVVGPYEFIGLVEIHVIGGSRFIASGYTDGGVEDLGRCVKCGTKIRFSYVIQASDGLKYALGSGCLRRIGLPHSVLEEVRKAERELKRRRRRVVENWRAARRFEESGVSLHEPLRELP